MKIKTSEKIKKMLDENQKGLVDLAVKGVVEVLKTDANRKLFGGSTEKEMTAEKKQLAVDYIKSISPKYQNDNGMKTALLQRAKDVGELNLTAGTGGDYTPDYLSSEIIRLIPTYGVIRKYGRVVPVVSDVQKIPTAGAVIAYRIGAGASLIPSIPATGILTLQVEKIACLIPFDNELLADATIGIVDLITQLSAEAIAKKEDTWGLLGENSGEGIMKNASVQVVTLASAETFAGATLDDLMDMTGKLDENAVNNAKYAMSFSVFNVFRKQKLTTQYALQNPAGGMPATIWNLPVIFSPVLPKTTDETQVATPFVICGNFDYLIIGDRGEYRIDLSTEGTYTDGSTVKSLFGQDMSAIRIIERVDIKVAEATKAFCILKTHAHVGA